MRRYRRFKRSKYPFYRRAVGTFSYPKVLFFTHKYVKDGSLLNGGGLTHKMEGFQPVHDNYRVPQDISSDEGWFGANTQLKGVIPLYSKFVLHKVTFVVSNFITHNVSVIIDSKALSTDVDYVMDYFIEKYEGGTCNPGKNVLSDFEHVKVFDEIVNKSMNVEYHYRHSVSLSDSDIDYKAWGNDGVYKRYARRALNNKCKFVLNYRPKNLFYQPISQFWNPAGTTFMQYLRKMGALKAPTVLFCRFPNVYEGNCDNDPFKATFLYSVYECCVYYTFKFAGLKDTYG